MDIDISQKLLDLLAKDTIDEIDRRILNEIIGWDNDSKKYTEIYDKYGKIVADHWKKLKDIK